MPARSQACVAWILPTAFLLLTQPCWRGRLRLICLHSTWTLRLKLVQLGCVARAGGRQNPGAWILINSSVLLCSPHWPKFSQFPTYLVPDGLSIERMQEYEGLPYPRNLGLSHCSLHWSFQAYRFCCFRVSMLSAISCSDKHIDSVHGSRFKVPLKKMVAGQGHFLVGG